METEIIALAHICCKLFPNMDGVSIMGETIGVPVGNTTIHVLIHKDNTGALVLAKTLPSQFISQANITIQRLFGFERRLWCMELSCLRFLPPSNLGAYSPKVYLNQGLKILIRNWWDSNFLVHLYLRWSVDDHFGYYLFCFNIYEQREYRQSSIQPRLEWYLTCPYLNNWIFIFKTQKITSWNWRIGLILDPKILIEGSVHIYLVHWSILIPHGLGKRNLFLS